MSVLPAPPAAGDLVSPRPIPVRPSPVAADGAVHRGSRPDLLARLAWWAVATLGVGAALASLTWPIGWDLGLFAWTADVVMRGGMVYRDAWDMHGPLVAYLMAIPLRLFGRHVWSLRLFDLLLVGVAMVGLWRLVRAAAPPRAARWTLVLFPLFYVSLGFNDTVQADAWAGLLATAAFAPALTTTLPRYRQLALAGLAVGVCIAIKPTHGLLLAVPLAYAIAAGRRSPGAVVRVGATLGAAAALPVAAVAASLAAHGTLDSLLEVHFNYPRAVYTLGNGASDLAWNARQYLPPWLLRGRFVAVAWPAALAGAVALWRGGRRPLLVALLTWAAAAVLPVLIQGKYYVYHWIPLWSPIAVLAAIGLAAAFAEAAGLARVLAAALLATLVGHALLRPTYYTMLAAQYAAGMRSEASYYERFNDGSPPAYLQVQAAEYMRSRLGPTEGVAIWGNAAGMLWHVDRPTPFRLAGWSWAVVEGRGSPWRERYRDEYVRSMRANPPGYFVIDSLHERRHLGGHIAEFPGLAEILATEYQLERKMGQLRLYRRVRSATAAPAAAAR